VLARFANSAGAAISFDARQTAGRSSPGLQGEYGAKLPMSIRETPQSVTVVTRRRMNDQGIKNLDDVLQAATGITVAKNGAERSVYTARGQFVGNPNYWQFYGEPRNFNVALRAKY